MGTFARFARKAVAHTIRKIARGIWNLMPQSYLKLLSGKAQHLFVDNADAECITLCGGSVIRVRSCVRIKRLEGDECPRCAALAFSPTAPKRHTLN